MARCLCSYDQIAVDSLDPDVFGIPLDLAPTLPGMFRERTILSEEFPSIAGQVSASINNFCRLFLGVGERNE
jgi:hypothetical protein